MDDPKAIARGLSEAQAAAIFFDERTHLEACELNAKGLVHLHVYKDSEGTLIDMDSRLTPLGLRVRAALQEMNDGR